MLRERVDGEPVVDGGGGYSAPVEAARDTDLEAVEGPRSAIQPGLRYLAHPFVMDTFPTPAVIPETSGSSLYSVESAAEAPP